MGTKPRISRSQKPMLKDIVSIIINPQTNKKRKKRRLMTEKTVIGIPLYNKPCLMDRKNIGKREEEK